MNGRSTAQKRNIETRRRARGSHYQVEMAGQNHNNNAAYTRLGRDEHEGTAQKGAVEYESHSFEPEESEVWKSHQAQV